jgi:hypothetical protein
VFPIGVFASHHGSGNGDEQFPKINKPSFASPCGISGSQSLKNKKTAESRELFTES